MTQVLLLLMLHLIPLYIVVAGTVKREIMYTKKCVLLLLCCHLLLGGAVFEFTPTVYPAKIHVVSSSQCD